MCVWFESSVINLIWTMKLIILYNGYWTNVYYSLHEGNAIISNDFQFMQVMLQPNYGTKCQKAN
jgi:hypothetical protein